MVSFHLTQKSGDFYWLKVGALTLFFLKIGNRKSIQTLKLPFYLTPEVFFWNSWRKRCICC